MNQKTSKVEKEFYLRCTYLTLSVLFDKEPKIYDEVRSNKKTTNIVSWLSFLSFYKMVRDTNLFMFVMVESLKCPLTAFC